MRTSVSQSGRLISPADADDSGFVPLPDSIRETARTRPDHTAISDGDRHLGWAELADLMDRCVTHLRAHGVQPGDSVASLGGTSAEHVVLYLGVLAAGACMVPLPISAHADTAAAMIENCAPRVIFADATGAEALGTHDAQPLNALFAALADCAPAPAETIPPDASYDIIYSSGTTGSPKGIEHDHLFRYRQMARFGGYGFEGDAVTLVSTPIYSNTTLSAMLPALARGGRIILMRKFDEAGFLQLAQDQRVTHAMLVPVQYRRILAHPDFDTYDLSAFRTKLCTSSPLPTPVIRDALARWPGRLVNIYGMTEGGIGLMLDCTAHPGKLHTVGQTVAGAEIRILDSDGRALPQGEAGEIVGRSPTMMRGYRNDPERTAQAIWTSPEGLAFIRSGDIGRMDDDGFLVLLDRGKDMIISGGFNIYCADLEEVLLRHADVAEAAVIGIPSERWGETPLAVVVPHPGAQPDPDVLRDWANGQLGKTQRLARVDLRESLPRSDIGKVLKRELRAPFWEGQTA